MKTRIIVAAIGLPLLLIVLCFLPYPATAIFFVAVNAAGTWELYHILHLEGRVGAMAATMLAGAAMQFIICTTGYWRCYVVVLPFLLLLFFCWIAYYEQEQAFGLEGIAASLFSGLCVSMGLGAMTVLRSMWGGRALVLAPLVVTFIGDSGAYFTGIRFGKRKMSPRTSPHKTIAGLIGGLASSAVGMVIYGLVLRGFDMDLSLWKLAIVGLLGGAAAQLGDLSFSIIKRYAGVKDYSNLLPGHGGAYDRFDSTIFAAPTVLALFSLLEVV